MKMTKKKLLEKVSNMGLEDDVTITLMEDIDDSFNENESNDEYKEKYEELLEKYKNRFFNPDVVEKEEEELEEKEIIDITEI